MIVNVPMSDALNKLALRLHFDAWSNLLIMEYQFDEVYDPDSEIDWSEERKQYYVYCQPELQAIYTVIQQSNELALKARICEVSPFLLLLNSEPKFSTTPKDIDFTTLRTLDAVDLPSAVNSLCEKKLSDKFIQSYNQIRSCRNQIAHLGATNKKFLPNELLHLLISQYRELWHDRKWLQDRVEFAAQTTTAFFHDGRYGTAHEVVMGRLDQIFETLTGSEFKALFGRSKTTRRYFCHACVYEGTTKYFSAHDDNCKTAYLNADGVSLHCIMCGKVTPIIRKKCKISNCKGDVIAKVGEFQQMCHSCEEFQGEATGDSEQTVNA